MHSWNGVVAGENRVRSNVPSALQQGGDHIENVRSIIFKFYKESHGYRLDQIFTCKDKFASFPQRKLSCATDRVKPEAKREGRRPAVQHGADVAKA